LYLGSWAAAESNFYLGRFEEAVRRYTVLADRHPQQVEELAALSQIWHCSTYYLKQQEPARAALQRIQATFAKLPESAYNGTTQYHNRTYWKGWLDDAAKQTPGANTTNARPQ